MLKAGDVAPDVELRDQSGTIVRLSDLLATGPVVLFFYPAALSTGCTAESCHFRDLAAEFAAVGAHRVGISPDAITKQRAFSEVNGFDYPLLSDVEGEVAKQFGVWRKLVPLHTKRATFVIGEDRKVIAKIKSELNFTVHADEALKVLRERNKVS